MPDIFVGLVTKIQTGIIFFDCWDFEEEEGCRCKRPLSFMDDQATHLLIGDIVEFVPHPDTPIKDGSLGRIRNRIVPNRFEYYNAEFPDMNAPDFEFKQYQYRALWKTNRSLDILVKNDLDNIDWIKEGF